ncbi:glycosyltransferase family 2 protein [Citrobacter gillenii]|uniref:glycosyltransferase family 2 protein n=1 Tax=Citrobacter gillenii TaxID=67828 RepID=UPI0039867159
MTSLVSIVMPTYNNASYIKMAIKDIQDQTYEDWELIIVNDGSTDNTDEILLEYKFCSKITIINFPSNKGICYALNAGLDIARGEYILRFDADDRCANDRIEMQLKYLQNNNFDLVGTSVTTINEMGEIIGYSTFSSDDNVLKRIIRFETPMLHIWLAKKEVYGKIGPYRIGGVEDYDFLLRVLDAGFRISNDERYYGVFIRKHSRNTASIHGWNQRRAFNLAWKLHRERVLTGREITSSVISNGFFSKYGNQLHSFSNRLLVKAISSNNFVEKTIYSIVSAAISPYQLQYLAFRFIGKLIKRKII